MHKISQTQAAQKRNNFFQGQLSMGGSGGNILIDQKLLNQVSSYKEVYILEGGLSPYLTLESNKYQLYMLKFVSNVAKKCFFGGESSGTVLSDVSLIGCHIENMINAM